MQMHVPKRHGLYLSNLSTCAALAIVALTLAISGCSGNSDPTPEPSPTSPPVETPPIESQLSISATTLDFGTVKAGSSSDQDLSLTNLGTTPLLLTVTFPENPSSQYSVSLNGSKVPDQIEGNSTLTLQVTFTPNANGDAPGTLRVDTNDRVTPRADISLSATGSGVQPDNDGDGYSVADGDCNDGDAAIHPGAAEACDGIDNDCDNKIDEDGASTFYQDADGDAHGDPSSAFVACKPGAGVVTIGDDCNDANAATFPGATEICDGEDNDCDTQVDENGNSTYYQDSDGDGHGDPDSAFDACEVEPGVVSVGDDCDDADPFTYPGAPELCDELDNNCNGTADEDAIHTYYQDQDGDGVGVASSTVTDCSQPAGYASVAGDCDDSKADVYPNALEACDGKDNDCDGKVDEDGSTTFYQDHDGDGYGDPDTAFEACSPGTGAVSQEGDCDDTSKSTYLGAPELCDGQDNDCDGKIDDGASKTYYQDRDNDGYGDSSSSATGCSAPAGYVALNGDCADNDASVHPGADEVCDGIDNDCDGRIDPNLEKTYYQDADGDHYGNKSVFDLACTAPIGYVSDSTDCNDSDASVYPAATEACDSKDNDCDGQVDEVGQQTYYADTDADSYGDKANSLSSCTTPAGYVTDASDCNDKDASVHPGATEACDSKDNDCDTLVDEVGQVTYYKDADGDSYGNKSLTQTSCSAPTGYVTDNTDCNDADPAIYPSASEACDGKDNDCDGKTDEDGVSTFYRDYDLDGHGDATTTQVGCNNPSGYVTSSDDCNDRDKSIYPGATETCDGKDNNCDAQIDEGVLTTWYLDSDKDTHGDAAVSLTACTQPTNYVSSSDDCNDKDKSAYPGAVETCDSKDNNCDGTVDEGVTSTWYLDADKDTYGDLNSKVSACTQPTLYVSRSGDCNDLDNTVYPTASELCDGKDNDCDNTIDEGVLKTFYADSDKDGYGNASVPSYACAASSGTVADNTDCDDTRSTVYPGATEVCDNLDNNCNTQIDEGVKKTYYLDSDGDGYGVSTSTIQACSAPTGYVSNSTDCNDSAPTTNPGAAEICDGKDNNCNTSIDEGVKLTFYSDVDKDGYGDANSPVLACSISTGLVSNNFDCNDANAAIYPGAPEKCDTKDNDCDGAIDEAGDTSQNLYYRDADNDGYGTTTPTLYACTAPSGYVSNTTDCNDADPKTYPGAPEQCLGGDNNCDGVVAPPAAPVASSNAPLCSGATLNLKATTVSGATYAWTGPNSFTSALQNPTISSTTSAAAGTYSVTAKVGTCTTAAATTTVVITTPSAAFTASTTTPLVNQSVTFTASQIGATYAWTFEGGSPSTSTSAAPIVTWTTTGTKAVSLTVTLNGCPATSTSSVVVSDAQPSCKTIKANNPSAADGVYTIDPDGAGSTPSFQAYCDMTTNGGGWMLIYYVDAGHFDGYIANNKISNSTPVTGINTSGDMWNPPSTVTWTETMFVCTQQNDAAKYYWSYSKADPAVWYINTTTDYNYQVISSASTSSSFGANCISTHKAESSYGFIVLETGTSCGTCTNMLFGNYHYSGGGDCNATSTTYGQHTSFYRSVSIGYPLCNKLQTSNGKFSIGIR